MIYRMARIGLVLLATMLTTECGSDAGQGPGSIDFLGEAADQLGDNLPHAGFTTTPDLVLVRIEVRGSDLRFIADFAAGTLDQLSEVTFALDTDQDPSTGDQGTAYDGLGVEFFLSLGPDQAAALTDYNGGSYSGVPISAQLSRSATRLRIDIPRAALNNDDGRLNFKTATSLSLGPGTSTGILDFSPEDASGPVVVQ